MNNSHVGAYQNQVVSQNKHSSSVKRKPSAKMTNVGQHTKMAVDI